MWNKMQYPSVKYVHEINRYSENNNDYNDEKSFGKDLTSFGPSDFTPFGSYTFEICFDCFYCVCHFEVSFFINRALKDLNPRHPVLETDVLPTELRTRVEAKGKR